MIRDPAGWDSFEDGEAVEPAVEHKVVRRSAQRIGEGAFACPCCDLPLSLGAPVGAAARIEGPFCGEAAAARLFLRLDAADTPGNRVCVRARLT